MNTLDLGPLSTHRTGHVAQPYIVQANWGKAAIVMPQQIRIPRASKFRVQREFRQNYTEYEYYISAGSDIDLVADTDNGQVPGDGYNDGRAHITVVSFFHKRVFRPKTLVYELV